jgi:hypothetical protein
MWISRLEQKFIINCEFFLELGENVFLLDIFSLVTYNMLDEFIKSNNKRRIFIYEQLSEKAKTIFSYRLFIIGLINDSFINLFLGVSQFISNRKQFHLIFTHIRWF